LERSGYKNVKIYEQSKATEPSAKGTGIMLACNAMQVMKKLGLHEEMEKDGNVLKRMNITDENLKVLACVDIEPFAALYGVNMIAIRREKLCRIVSSKMEIETFLGKRLEKINPLSNRMNMIFGDSTEVRTDLVIGADGIRSKVRNSCFPAVKTRDSGQLCWRGIADIDMSEYAHELNEMWGKGKRFGFVKISPHQIYWYALINATWNGNVTISDLNHLFKDFHPDVLDIINSTDENGIITKSVFDFKTPRQWHKAGICMLGDAAHAMTPNLGQGACQAIEDAYVLSECLKRHESTQAFARYNKIRRDKAAWITERSRKIGMVSQLNHTTGIWLRNSIMRIVPPRLAYMENKKMFDLCNI